jgi:type II secretory pathway component PulJ
MLAVMVMALVAFAIYRFVDTTLQSIRQSTADSVQKGAVQALVAVLSEQLTNLPAQEPGALLGVAHKFGGKDSDELAWLAQSGNGLFTQDAAGEWKVTLILRPQEKTNTYTLGLLRQVPDTTNTEEHWLPLLSNVDAIQVRYFDQRLNTWVEQWNDVSTRPALVRVRIWRTAQTTPYEAVIELPPTRLPS